MGSSLLLTLFGFTMSQEQTWPLNPLTRKGSYAIVENLPLRLDALALYQFYCGRQTIENFFKEEKNPFNAGKMPSEKFRACEAYIQFVVIAYNLFEWFKKNFSPRNGDTIKWKSFES